MPQAKISINGVDGSNDNLPINTLVQLSNDNSGGEFSYAWTILNQPDGPTDSLSATNIQNPTLTPKKEGTYLVQLIVNGSLEDVQIAAIRYLKSLERAPAAGETTEDSEAEGWEIAQNNLNSRVDALVGDPGTLVAVAGQAGLVAGNIVRATTTAVIKSGLPGQETLPSVTLVNPNVLADLAMFDSVLYYLVGGVDGNPSPSSGDLVVCRSYGLATSSTAAATSGDSIFIDLNGFPVPLGSIGGVPPRCIGKAVTTGNPFTFVMNGFSPIPRPGVMLYGNNATAAAGTTRYMTPGYSQSATPSGEVKVLLPSGIFVYNMLILATAAATCNETFTLRKNGVDTTLTATLLATNTAVADTGHFVLFSQDDQISVSAVGTGTSAGPTNVTLSLSYYSPLING